MPRLAIDLGDTYESVVRPAALDVIKQVMQRTGIDPKTRLIFPGAPNKTLNIGSTIDDDNKEVAFVDEEHLLIETTVQYIDEDMLTTPVFRNEQLRIFSDDETGVYLAPAYGIAEVVMSVRYKAQSRSAAERWLSELKRRAADGFREQVHNVEYYYPVPKEMVVILDQIHQMRESVAPYDQTLNDYFTEHFSDKMTFLTNQSGTQTMIAIREKQSRIIGYFNFEAVPTKEREDGDTWLISFDYTFRLDRAHSVAMQYPLIVHNQLLDQRFFDADVDYNRPLEVLLGRAGLIALNTLASREEPLPRRAIPGWSIPAFDEWIPQTVPMSTTSIARFLFAVSSDYPTFLLNFTELGEEYGFIDPIRDYILRNHAFVTQVGESPILFSLYQDNEMMDHNFIYMNDAGDLFTQNPLALRRRYHGRVSIYNDLSLLSERCLNDLMEHGEIARLILYTLEPSLRQNGGLPLLSTGRMGKRVFWEAVQRIKGTNDLYKGPIEVSRYHVATMIVRTRR